MKYSIRRVAIDKYVVKYRCSCNVELESPHIDIGTKQQCPTCYQPFEVPGSAHWEEIENRIAAERNALAEREAAKAAERDRRAKQATESVRAAVASVAKHKVILLSVLATLLAVTVPAAGFFYLYLGKLTALTNEPANNQVAVAEPEKTEPAVVAEAEESKPEPVAPEPVKEEPPAEPPKAPPKRVKIFDHLYVGKLKYMVDRLNWEQRPGGSYMLRVNLHVRNTGNQPVNVPRVGLVRFATKAPYLPSTKLDEFDFRSPLNPGVARNGPVYFEVPDKGDYTAVVASEDEEITGMIDLRYF